MCYELPGSIQNMLYNNAQTQAETLRIEAAAAEALLAKNAGAVLIKDGDQWCCLMGELSEPNSVAGFGSTPAHAIGEFCKNYGAY